MEYANKNSIPSLNISFPWPSSSSYLLLPGTPPPPSKPFMICQQEVFVSHLLAPFSFYHFCHFIILPSLTARADFVGASSASRRHFVGASSASRRRIVGACQRLSALIGAYRRLVGAYRRLVGASSSVLSSYQRIIWWIMARVPTGLI